MSTRTEEKTSKTGVTSKTASETIPSERKQQAKEKIQEAKHDVQDLGRLAKDIANETVHNLRSNANEYVEKSRTMARDLQNQLSRQIRTNPFQSLLIALGFGALLGFFWKRSKRKD